MRARAGGDIALPSACEQIYSAGMLAALQAGLPPLNDPGVTLYATQVVPALEILESGIPTLRCTWGAPGGNGLATSVSIVDDEQATRIQDALTGNGFGCEDVDGGILCRTQTETVDLDDEIVTRGETHVLRGDGWITTAWIGEEPAGYTEDIAATLWG